MSNAQNATTRRSVLTAGSSSAVAEAPFILISNHSTQTASVGQQRMIVDRCKRPNQSIRSTYRPDLNGPLSKHPSGMGSPATSMSGLSCAP